jgi:hypothetical protein
MKTFFKLKCIVLILHFFFFFTNCSGQGKYNSEYSIGTIPDIAKFEKMTEREVRLDTLNDRHHAKSMQSMLDGTAFIEGVSEKDKLESIEYEKNKFKKYKDNRSRYYMDLFINDERDTDYFQGIDTLTTECGCYLSSDTVRIKMGFWVFGGFEFSIDLTKNNFKSSYWEDTHKQPIYKSNLENKGLVDNVHVENEEQSLVLASQPTFLVDDTIVGYLIFKTKKYYRKKNYRSIASEEDTIGKYMDTLNMKGALYFKCKLRKKTIGDR